MRISVQGRWAVSVMVAILLPLLGFAWSVSQDHIAIRAAATALEVKTTARDDALEKAFIAFTAEFHQLYCWELEDRGMKCNK